MSTRVEAKYWLIWDSTDDTYLRQRFGTKHGADIRADLLNGTRGGLPRFEVHEKGGDDNDG